MSALSHLAALVSQIKGDGVTAPASKLLLAQMMLERLRQSLDAARSAQSDRQAVANSSGLAAFCSTYIIAANIFLYRALGSLSSGHTLVQQSVLYGLNAGAECRGQSKLILNNIII